MRSAIEGIPDDFIVADIDFLSRVIGYRRSGGRGWFFRRTG
jgi:hypothetical protein